MKTEKVLKKNAIKAYKAFNSDLTCKGFQYEVGKEYHHKGALEMCNSSFHACPKLVDCFSFYPFSETKTRVAEVLVWGKVEHEANAAKLCASKIKVVRELAWNEVLSLCNNGSDNSGYRNSGHGNSGDCNSGNHNSGDWNSGDCNSGHWNSGNWNSGHWNSGNWNSGDFNSGNNNIGYHNSGYHNRGNNNSGYHNSGDWHSGIFNTEQQEYIFAFNKPALKSAIVSIYAIPFLRFDMSEWVPDCNMSQQEKEQHPEYVTTGGYQKQYDYKEAFRKSFEKAKRLPDWPEQLEKLKSLPNFDAKIFEEITGIPSKDLGISAKELADKPKTAMEVTMADIEKVFGCKIKIVKDR